MRTYGNVIEAIGRTPLIKLRKASELTGANIYGKAEFLNPGQSVKDRAALGMIRDAEKSGRLQPGGLIVEGTAGNTGIGLAVVGNALGYRTVIVMPRTQSQEKKDAVRSLGAKLVEVDAVPYANPNHYVKYSQRLAEEMAKTEPNGAIWANQFDNTANRNAHYEATGPEIWEQTDGKVDGFICSVGSGGTLGGVSMALKERSKKSRSACGSRRGFPLLVLQNRELKADGTSITEGIGQSRITANLEGVEVDDAWRIDDADALRVLFDLTRNEGMCLGGSSGINIAGAMEMARKLGKGSTVVTILCDYGNRYLSKLYNGAFLKEKGLPTPDWYES
jgi:cysteine synthase A